MEMKADRKNQDNVVEELEEIRKDPKKWEEFMATQAEKALDHWRGQKKSYIASFKTFGRLVSVPVHRPRYGLMHLW